MIHESLIFSVSGVRQVSDLEISIHQGFHSQDAILFVSVCVHEFILNE